MSPYRSVALMGFVLGCALLGLGMDKHSWTLGMLGLATVLAAPCLSFGNDAIRPVAGFILGGLIFGWGLDVDSLALGLGGLGIMIAAPLAFAPARTEQGPDPMEDQNQPPPQ